MTNEPPKPSVFDLYRTLGNDVSRDVMNAFMTMPVSLEAIVEGESGVDDVPPEQLLEAYVKIIRAFIGHVPRIASAATIALAEIETLKKHVMELEARLGDQ